MSVRWGIAGCGWIARDHVVPAMRAAGHRAAAAYSPVPGEAAALGADLATHDLERFLAAPLDAVYVAAPNHAHRPLVEAAAAAGHDVLCEKPMATTLADARAMVGACRAAGVRYGTAHNQRHHPAHRALAALVAGGALGSVTQASVRYACTAPSWWGEGDWHWDPARAGGGAVFDLAPHGIDLIGVLTGTLPVEVAALRQRALLDQPVEDGGVVVVRYAPGDLLGVVQVAYTSPETLPRRVLTLTGTAGMAVATDTMGQTPGGRLEVIDAADGGIRDVPFDRQGDPFAAQLAAFARDEACDPERDLRTMAALEAAMCAEGLTLAAVVPA